MSPVDQSKFLWPKQNLASANLPHRVFVDIIFNCIALLQLLLSNEVVKVY